MHSFEIYERIIRLSVLSALTVLFIAAALNLLTGCGEFLMGDNRNFITFTPDTNEYLGSLPKVPENFYKDRP